MEEINNPKETFDIRLTRDEVEYIRNITQNNSKVLGDGLLNLLVIVSANGIPFL